VAKRLWRTERNQDIFEVQNSRFKVLGLM